MTPPEMLRRAADIIDEAKANGGGDLTETADLVAEIHAALQDAVNPDPIESVGRWIREQRRAG